MANCSRSGLVESKVRHFVGKLEQVGNIELAHPFNKSYEEEFTCCNDDEAFNAARGQPPAPQPEAAEGEDTEKKEEVKVYTANHYIGLVIDPSKSRQIDVSWACEEFYDICKAWPLYNEDHHSIHVVQHRAYVSRFLKRND